jgi:hypothetical protein
VHGDRREGRNVRGYMVERLGDVLAAFATTPEDQMYEE